MELLRVLDAAAGLTRYEAESAMSLALVRHGHLEPSAIWQLKAQALTKSGLLTLRRGRECFDTLGGLASLKAFCLRALRQRSANDTQAKARGVLLLGVPGTGKSAFAKSLGNETGRPTLTLDVGSLMGSLVGQTEERTRRALDIVDRMQPAVLFVDELEKALAGRSRAARRTTEPPGRTGYFPAFVHSLNKRSSRCLLHSTIARSGPQRRRPSGCATAWRPCASRSPGSGRVRRSHRCRRRWRPGRSAPKATS
ncbi:MAG: AAA family ATPase [Planctomycetes bacterium]|nr:AAA family ATPase [Planctomycetota bacterium]